MTLRHNGNGTFGWKSIKARIVHNCNNAFTPPRNWKKDVPSDCARLVKPKETYYKWTWSKPGYKTLIHNQCSPCQDAGRQPSQPLVADSGSKLNQLSDIFTIPTSDDGPSGVKNLFRLG